MGHRAGDTFRVVQLTPPGSACSIDRQADLQRDAGLRDGPAPRGSDIEAARAELTGRGMDVGEFFHFDPSGRAPGLEPNRADYGSFCSFSDPDGNTWMVQEVKRATTRE